jgi:hypothetical protein
MPETAACSVYRRFLQTRYDPRRRARARAPANLMLSQIAITLE